VEVNCAVLPATLLEAELFGTEKGAFADARTAKPGLFEAAHGGTLFLDEIGGLSAELQAKLLRVLEAKRVRRLVSVRDQEVDVRIVAATHVDLPARVREGAFRNDLFYRRSVVPVELPSLRDRGDDVVMLARHFPDRFGREYEIPAPELTPEIRGALLVHAWPGNVRELKNSIERAMLLGDGALRRQGPGAGRAGETGGKPRRICPSGGGCRPDLQGDEGRMQGGEDGEAVERGRARVHARFRHRLTAATQRSPFQLFRPAPLLRPNAPAGRGWPARDRACGRSRTGPGRRIRSRPP
jgi:DNA-binding NtrC family response regulator